MARRLHQHTPRPGRDPARETPAPELCELHTGDFETLQVEDPTRPRIAMPRPPSRVEAVPNLPGETRILPEDPQRAVPTEVFTNPLVVVDEATSTEPVKPPPPVRTPRPPAALEPAFLHVERGPSAGSAIPVPEGETVIGRASSCGLRINHASVSRRHAIIIRSGSRFILRDCGSHNGTKVNGRKVRGQVDVRSGDEIVLGKVVLLLRHGVTDTGLPTMTTTATSTSVPLSDRPLLKILVFAGAAMLGIGAVLAMATLGGPPEDSAAQPDPEPRVETGRRADPGALESGRAPQPPLDTAQPLPVPDPVRAAVELPAREEVSAARVFAESQTRGAEPGAEMEVPQPILRRSRPEPARVKEPRPTRAEPARTAKSPSALAQYEAGDVDGAISAARAAGDEKLATRLSAFKKALASARAALSFKDGGGAIKQLSEALAIDQELSKSGTSKPGGEVRSQLSRLYQIAGLQAIDDGDRSKALALLKRAIKYDPGNTKAREFLSRLESTPEPRAHARSEGDIDLASQPQPQPRPEPAPRHEPRTQESPARTPTREPAKADPRSAADEAFGD